MRGVRCAARERPAPSDPVAPFGAVRATGGAPERAGNDVAAFRQDPPHCVRREDRLPGLHERIPADRAVQSRELLDQLEPLHEVDLVPADLGGCERAEDTGFPQRVDEVLRHPPLVLELVLRGEDQWRQAPRNAT